MEFLGPRVFDVSDSKQRRISAGLNKLGDALHFNRLGYLAHDPMREFELGVYGAALNRRLETLKEFPAARVLPTVEDMRSASKENIEFHIAGAKEMLAHPEKFTPSELEKARKIEKNVQAWSRLYEDYLAARKWDPRQMDGNSAIPEKMRSKYRAYLTRTRHPLIDPASWDQSHGTHVSGIIAKQNAKLRVTPIRVTTESVKNSPIADQKMLAEFTEGFSNWMRDPLVVRAIEGRFSGLFSGKKGDALIAEVMKIFAEEIPKNFEASKLDFRFLGEVEKAIALAGKHELKLVNISLGTTFDRAVIDYRNLDSVKTLTSYFEFMKFEYFKWRVAVTANREARNTLFVVATGNDGAWRDGRSRSALPVDLSSPFLADYEDAAKGLLAPNNQIKNILGVGSLSQLDELSSFTNILISKAPMVMAHGEAVLSPIRSFSQEAVSTYFKQAIDLDIGSAGIGSILVDPDRMGEFMKRYFKLSGSVEELKQAYERISAQVFMDVTAFDAFGPALQTDLFLRYPNVRGRYSGTSMAAPTLTGLLANDLQKLAESRGIPAKDLYRHPDFAPEKLIQMVEARSETVFPNSTVISLKKWTGEIPWEKSSQELELEALMAKAKQGRATFLTDATPRTAMRPVDCKRLLDSRH